MKITILSILLLAVFITRPGVSYADGILGPPPCCSPDSQVQLHGNDFPFPNLLLAALDPNERSSSAPRANPRERSGQTAPATQESDDDEDRQRGNRPRTRIDGTDEIAALDRLLAMSSEQLSHVRRTVEQIEAMSPDEREALRERLRDFREVSPEERKKLREDWADLSPEERREHMRRMRERHWLKAFEDSGSEENKPESRSEDEKSAKE